MLHSLFLMGIPNTGELLLILFVIIIFFGAKRIPEMFKGIGQGVREFKDATKTPETQQPQYRDQSSTPPVQPPYQQYPPQGYPQQPQQQQYPQQGYPQQGGYPQEQYPQPGQSPQGNPQQSNPQQGYQQPVPPVYNPNDPNNQPRQ